MPKVCSKCQGSGMQTGTSGGLFAMPEPCEQCRGRGMVVEDPCTTCRGSGRAASNRTMQVKVPAGVKDGQKVRLRGKGGKGESGSNGDLLLVVLVEPHRIFARKGDNLTITVPVRFDEAALGAEIQVPTLGGSPVKIRIPVGTANGRTFRARGTNTPKKASGVGDLLVTVDVRLPAELSGETRTAIEADRTA